MNIATSDGNITMSVAGNANIIVISGTDATLNTYKIGYREIPQIAFSSNATLALADSGKHFLAADSGKTLTIPTNGTVAFPIGTVITLATLSSNMLINANSGVTLYLAGNGTPANRLLDIYATATLLKVSTDIWMLNGTSLT